MTILPTAGYKYAGLPLTSKVFAELMLELVAGERLRRNEFATRITEYHRSNGGLEGVQSPMQIAKKALSALAATGLAEQTGAYGIWAISGDRPAEAVAEVSEIASDEFAEYLYVYYLPTYRVAAELAGNDKWPHKVGMTRTSVASRIADQIGTALPERPVVAFSVSVEDAALVERAVHAVLSLRAAKIDDAPGSEWFTTNEAEVKEILAFCGITV